MLKTPKKQTKPAVVRTAAAVPTARSPASEEPRTSRTLFPIIAAALALFLFYVVITFSAVPSSTMSTRAPIDEQTPPAVSTATSLRGIAPKTPVYYINPLVLRLGTTVSLDAWVASPLISFKSSKFDTIVDVGAFDGADYTLPGFRMGYTVFAFEFNPSTQLRLIRALSDAGLVEGTDFTVIKMAPGTIPTFERLPNPHIYVFCAGASNQNGGFPMRVNEDLVAAETTEVGGVGDGGTLLPVLRLDDVIPSDARIFTLKIDAQGHEPFVLEGAREILRRSRVHLISLEWWPAGIQKQGVADGGKAALASLYEAGAECFDLRSHKAYVPLDRPSEVGAWIDFLLRVPRTGDAGDILGGWENLVCILDKGD